MDNNLTTYEIYKLTDLTNNKIYIGGTTEGAGLRFKRHVLKAKAGSSYPLHKAIIEHGENNFKIDILEMCEDLNTMNERESYWIVQLSATNPEIGYNAKVGGGIRFQSEETKLKIGDIHRGKISEKRKPILMYSSDGNFIKEFPALSIAAKEMNLRNSQILRGVSGKMVHPSSKNPYIWIYKEEGKEIELKVDPDKYYLDRNFKMTQSENFKIARERNANSCKNGFKMFNVGVYQYDLNWKLIGKYKTITDASKSSGISTTTIRKFISNPEYVANLKDTKKTKYFWKRAEANDPDIIYTESEVRDKIAKSKSKKVLKKDLNGNVVHVYNSVTELEKTEHVDSRTIFFKIKQNLPHNGFYWEII